jgi:hypothetical protein
MPNFFECVNDITYPKSYVTLSKLKDFTFVVDGLIHSQLK